MKVVAFVEWFDTELLAIQCSPGSVIALDASECLGVPFRYQRTSTKRLSK